MIVQKVVELGKFNDITGGSSITRFFGPQLFFQFTRFFFGVASRFCPTLLPVFDLECWKYVFRRPTFHNGKLFLLDFCSMDIFEIFYCGFCQFWHCSCGSWSEFGQNSVLGRLHLSYDTLYVEIGPKKCPKSGLWKFLGPVLLVNST